MSAFVINGTQLIMQPTEHRWLIPNALGRTGDGHFIFSAVYEYELMWNVNTPEEWQQILTFYQAISVTGTYVVALPQIDAATYVFKNYSGCTISHPTMEKYFAEHVTVARMYIGNIRI